MIRSQDKQIGLRGLVDFSRVLRSEFGPVYGAYQRSDFRVPPGGLSFSTNEQGLTDIRLSLIRGALPFLPPEPYGSLALGVCVEYESSAILDSMREEFPAMTLQEVQPEQGYIRLLPPSGSPGSTDTLPLDTCRPTRLFREGGQTLRLSINTSIISAEILAQMILQGTLSAQVFLEYELAGVCARHTGSVVFDADLMLSTLEGILRDERDISILMLRDFISSQSSRFVLKPHNGQAIIFDDAVLDTVLDRFIARFGVFVARADPDGAAQVKIPLQDNPGFIEWDLSRPVRVKRMLTLRTPTLHTLETPDQQRAKYVQRVVLANISSGMHQVQLHANMASYPLGLFMMGVHLSVPAVPPHRLQPVNRSVRFNPPSFVADVLLPLAVLEPLRYQMQGFISVETNRGVLDLRGALSDWQQDQIQVLAADALGAKFICLSLDDSLARIAAVQGIFEFEYLQQIHQIKFALSDSTPLATLVAPQAASVQIRMRLTPVSGGEPLTIEEQDVQQAIHLDMNRFHEYGPHSVQLHCALPDGVHFCEVECSAETLLDDPRASKRLVFFSDTGSRQWNWFAQSPFEFGYCYRLRFTQEQPFGAWSAPLRDLSDHWISLNPIEIESIPNRSLSKSNQVGTPE